MPVLSKMQIDQQLAELSDPWFYQNKRLRAMIETKDFLSGLSLVNQIGQLAEKLNHHPKICLSYTQVEISLWTHEARDVTEKDFTLAQKIDNLL
jgi:4a-hydroxytetrahydrobiopterin dehydratase